MTNEEWESCADPDLMLVGLASPENSTELRKWCCLCVRRVWNHIADEGRDAVVASEQFADGRITTADLDHARVNAEKAVDSLPDWGAKNAQRAAAWCASLEVDALGIARFVAWGAAYAIGAPDTDEGSILLAQERKAQADLLRKVFTHR